MGFQPPAFSQTSPQLELAAKPFGNTDLSQSGCSPLVLVDTGRGGAEPGQILDKSFAALSPETTSLAKTHSHVDDVQVSHPAEQVASPTTKNQGPRSKAEIEVERYQRWERTCAEVDAVYQEYKRLLPANLPTIIAVIYARFSTRFQDSIADQVREILEFALAEGLYVPREYIFFDLAVRGYKQERQGLSQVKAVLKSRQASVLLLFSTSRLFRKKYFTLQFVDEMHKGLGIRCVFVKSGVDTNDKSRWEMMLNMQSTLDQFVVSVNVANVQAAHEGLFARQIVFGTLSYGYAGEDVPGELTKRGKPRRRIVLDPVTAATVRQIFAWFLGRCGDSRPCERLSISEIIQRLNALPDVPLPPRAISGQWTRLAVRHVLTNTRYQGLWRYGVTESTYISAGDYTRQRRRAAPLKEVQIDELRIIDDASFFETQARLAALRPSGRPPRDQGRAPEPKLLNGLLFCGVHSQLLYVGGAHGSLMHCPICQRLEASDRPLFTALNRKLVLQVICGELATRVAGDSRLVDDIIAACQLEADLAQRPDPAAATAARKRIEQIDRAVAFTRDTIGNSDEERNQATKQIRKLQAERASLQATVSKYEDAARRQPRIPTRDEIVALLARLGDIFRDAARAHASGSHELRQIIEFLTGGRINVYQMGERTPRRGWLQARINLRLLPYLVEQLAGAAPVTDEVVDVTVDIRRPSGADTKADQAWQLYQDGLLEKDIAQRLECSRANVTRLLKKKSKELGVVKEDGRVRRQRLEKKQTPPTQYDTLVTEVMRQYDDSMPLQDIAAALGVDRNVITNIVRIWHERNNLPVPDGRNRRKLIGQQIRQSNGD